MAKETGVYLVRKGDKVYALTKEGMTKSGNPKWRVNTVPYSTLEQQGQSGAWSDSYDFMGDEQIGLGDPMQIVDRFETDYAGKKQPNISGKGVSKFGLRDGNVIGLERDKPTPSGNPARKAFMGRLPNEGETVSTTRQRHQVGLGGSEAEINEVYNRLIQKLGGQG